jgi:tripartite-type tricarboxylate transporter receptor subunit TctC
VIASNSVVINLLLKKTNYNALTSYEAVCNLVSSPLIFVVNNASPYQTIGDLIAEAHAKPGTLTLAALGPATTQHNIRRATGIRHENQSPPAGGVAWQSTSHGENSLARWAVWLSPQQRPMSIDAPTPRR